jgi:hypothetical protein
VPALPAALIAAVPPSARLLVPAMLAALIAAVPASARAAADPLAVRRAPLTLRGSGRSSITVTRR